MTKLPLPALVAALLLLGAAALAAPTPAEPPRPKLTADDVSKADKAVKDHLESIKGGAGSVTQIKDAGLEKALPDHAFFFVLYRQFPVGRIPPKGLKSSNVFAWGRDGKLQVLTEDKEAGTFLKEKVTASTDEQMKNAVRAWLVLLQHLSQDGFYRFTLVDEATKVGKSRGGKTASGKVVVMEGGNGLITGEITFDKAGKITAITRETKLRAGPRPRCQATKLLDKDPLVRAMAEDALLGMGRFASYLDEQRAKASPELKQAIDALWERIVDRDQD